MEMKYRSAKELLFHRRFLDGKTVLCPKCGRNGECMVFLDGTITVVHKDEPLEHGGWQTCEILEG